MMKRIIAILLLVAIGMTLVACAPDACDECGTEGVKLKKIKFLKDKKNYWLCEDCAPWLELANELYKELN